MEDLIKLQMKDEGEFYRRERSIAIGGQGQIYVASDRKDPQRKEYALKQQDILESLGKDQSMISVRLLRMLREIFSNSLKHPHIVSIKESFLTPEGKFITISELASEDLKNYRTKHGNLSV